MAVSQPRSRYTVVGKLRASGRAELSICLPRGAHRVDDVVLVKTFAPGALERGVGGVPDEIELASRLHHDNIVRTLGCGTDDGKDFIVTEYLEGLTLRRLLEWLHGHGEKLVDAAVARVLLGIFAAVEHATRCATTSAARTLVHQVVAAEDVFITCKGDVKVLGFKPASRFDGSDASALMERAAVDALLSTQRSAELATVLARVGARLSPSSVLGLWQIARALESWQEQSLGSDGRDELAAVMAKLLPEGRATRRAHLEAACARVRLRLAQEQDEPAPLTSVGNLEATAEAAEDAPPVSGFRTTGASAALMQAGPDADPDIDAMFTPSPPAVLGEPVGHAAGLSLRVNAELPMFIDVLPRPRASRRRLAIDTSVHDALGVRLPWLLVAVAAGAAAAFGVHHVAREYAAPAAAEAAVMAAPMPGEAALTQEAAVTQEAAPQDAVTQEAAPQDAVPSPPAEVVAVATQPNENVQPSSAAPESTPPAAPVAQQPGLRSTAGRWKLPGGEPRPSTEPTNVEPPGAPAMGRGYLTLDTTPWSMVSMSGTALGQTPLVKIELPAGQHVLELSNPELGIVSSVVVDVVAGLTMVRRIGLERPGQAASR